MFCVQMCENVHESQICIYKCVCVCVCVCVLLHTYSYICIQVGTSRIYVDVRVRVCVNQYVYRCVYVKDIYIYYKSVGCH